MREKLSWAVTIVASMALGAAAVVGIDALRADEPAPAAVATGQPAPTGGAVAPVASDVADLYERLRPSVVKITTGNANSFASGVGSGVVIDKEGHILTNYHVIAGASSITVTFPDRTSVQAKVLGTDPGDDLAVLDVDVPAANLTPATLGDSSAVRVGELVLAIGNPFEIEGSLTQGVVSGLGRTLQGNTSSRPLRQLIQSDAAINPGNSGGGLFNARGELIGITTAIENPSGDRVFVGIGYAVPINVAKRFLPQMVAGQRVERPRIGISMSPAANGVLIETVQPNSPASRAGLRRGDVIVAIDDQPVRTADDLGNYVDTKDVGDKVKLRVLRGGDEVTVEVTLDAWPTNSST